MILAPGKGYSTRRGGSDDGAMVGTDGKVVGTPSWERIGGGRDGWGGRIRGSSPLASRSPSGDGLAQAFQQAFELGLAMLHPPHAVPQLLYVVSQPCL